MTEPVVVNPDPMTRIRDQIDWPTFAVLGLNDAEGSMTVYRGPQSGLADAQRRFRLKIVEGKHGWD